MDLQKFKEWVEVVAATFGVLRTAKDMLPEGPQREATAELIDQSERSFKAVEAELARTLGFRICPRCWPPEILLIEPDDVLRCRHCRLEPPAGDEVAVGF